MDKKIFYKVVNDKRESCLVEDPEWKIIYPKGEVVKAKNNSMLFIFDDLSAAEDFAENAIPYFTENKILKVRPIGKLYKPVIRPVIYNPSFIENFWKNFSEFKKTPKERKGNFIWTLVSLHTSSSMIIPYTFSYTVDPHTVLCKELEVLT